MSTNNIIASAIQDNISDNNNTIISNSFLQELLNKIEEGNNIQRKILETQEDILNAIEENNELQRLTLERMGKKEKRKISSIDTFEPSEFDDSVSTVSNTVVSIVSNNSKEKERKRNKKNTCSEDELCIIYEGSSNHSIIVRKDLLKGPVLKTAVSGNFLEESTFVLPSDSIKLSNISKSMKQLKKFFHGERLDKCNEEGKKDLLNLADFLVLPEIKLELLKVQIEEIPLLKKKKNEYTNYSKVLKCVEDISKQLPEILINLEPDEMLSVLESFHEFLKGKCPSETFSVVVKKTWNRKDLSILLQGRVSLDGMIYYLVETYFKDETIPNEKINLLRDAIQNEQWKNKLELLTGDNISDSDSDD